MRPRPQRENSDQSGFALVAVLLVVAILSLIAVSMLSSGRIATQLARSSARQSAALAVADAGVARAILGLMDQRPSHQLREDGTPQTISVFGKAMTVSIEDELGKIDLNAADETLLRNLFLSVNVSAQDADTLVDRILDWRGSSDVMHLNGLSTVDYSLMVSHPRHGPFQRLDELLLVPGMTPALFQRIAPAITVYSGHPMFDPTVASPAVLRALPNLDGTEIDRLLSARRSETAQMQSVDKSPLGRSAAGRAFTINVTLARSDGAAQHVTEIVRLTGDPRNPYWVLFRTSD